MNFKPTYTIEETTLFINWIDNTAKKAAAKGLNQLAEICTETKKEIDVLRYKMQQGLELSSQEVEEIRCYMKHFMRLMPDAILTEA